MEAQLRELFTELRSYRSETVQVTRHSGDVSDDISADDVHTTTATAAAAATAAATAVAEVEARYRQQLTAKDDALRYY
jgi:hypothetical protein